MEDKLSDSKNKGVDFSKRALLKTALISSIAVTSGAVVAKKITLREAGGPKGAYLNDDLQQDNIMKEKKYLLMTPEEKTQLVKTFVDNYKYTA